MAIWNNLASDDKKCGIFRNIVHAILWPQHALGGPNNCSRRGLGKIRRKPCESVSNFVAII